MKKNLVFAAFFAMLLGLIWGSTAMATVFDITTYAADTEQGRVARYVGAVVPNGDTVGYQQHPTMPEVFYDSQGLYDHASFAGFFAHWYNLCDGELTEDFYGVCSTFGGDTSEDFFGYMFKMPATVQEINFVNTAMADGGTFAAEPRVEVLVGGTLKSGGTWQTVSASWDTSYVIDYGLNGTGSEDRAYSLTVDTTPGAVWGVRMIGAALDHWYNSENQYIESGDSTGFLTIPEMQVTGDVTITNQIDLTTNLALNQTPILAAPVGQGDAASMTDGDYGAFVNTVGYDTTTLPNGEEYMGVMFDTAQTNVAAIGACQKMYDCGGYFIPATIRVEYTTDNGSNWVAATNLDLGRYAEDYADLQLVPWSQYDTELFTFDTITAAIDGIRLIGTPLANDIYSGDTTGFVATNEFEVFAAVIDDIPGDANHDDQVDASDATILAGNWQAGPGATWEMGDFNGDGYVDASDATILAGNWQAGTGSTAVPEPSTIALLFCAALFGIILRRNRS
ncbi:MAG: dockerin type I domain-containing protein [Planctomycetia bacterium]